MNKGFTNLRKNFKMLKFNNGNVEKVLEIYNKKKDCDIERITKKLKTLGLEEKNQKLIELGHTNYR